MKRYKKMKQSTALTRRDFIKAAGTFGAAMMLPTIIPSAVFGRRIVAPSEKITVGIIGSGPMGQNNMRSFFNQSDARVIAVCDVDTRHLQKAKQQVDHHYQNTDCRTYTDFRELIACDEIDAVCVATPDHWHALVSIEAIKSGKDVYCEKPLTHSLEEGLVVCEFVKQYGTIFQVGSQQRSSRNFRLACELVRNGRIGKVRTVEVGLPAGHPDLWKTAGQETISEPPVELHYDMWLGPAPYQPYCPARIHRNWRWHLDYGGGILLDWIGHHGDIGQWGIGMERSGPVLFDGKGVFPTQGLWNSPTNYNIRAKYENGTEIVIADNTVLEQGTRWIGDDGWILVSRKELKANTNDILRERIGPDEINLYQSVEHHRNFLDCIRTRNETVAPAEIGHRSATMGHLGLISMLLDRQIKWDPETQRIKNDDTATRLLGRSYRSPWRLV